jgi:hypothetical protein
MHKSQSLFYLTTALHVSDYTITHLQVHKTTVTTESGYRYTVLLSAAIVEELEQVADTDSVAWSVQIVTVEFAVDTGSDLRWGKATVTFL